MSRCSHSGIRRRAVPRRVHDLPDLHLGGLPVSAPRLDGRKERVMNRAAQSDARGFSLIEVLVEMGNEAEAVLVYDRMRRLLRDVAHGRPLGDVTTLANAEIVEQIREMSDTSSTEE